MPTIVPVPRARILSSKPSLAPRAPPTSPLNPTHVAPDLPTIGISAASNPPEIGPSAFAPATRLETTTTLTTAPAPQLQPSIGVLSVFLQGRPDQASRTPARGQARVANAHRKFRDISQSPNQKPLTKGMQQ